MKVGDRAVTADQYAAPDHWTNAQQHYFQLIDGGGCDLGHDSILATDTCEAIAFNNLPRFFPLSKMIELQERYLKAFCLLA